MQKKHLFYSKMARFNTSDFSNMHTCMSHATALMKAEDLPSLGNLISNVAKASREEHELTDNECKSITDCITLALQSQKVVPSRTYDPASLATLGELVTKLTPKDEQKEVEASTSK